MAHILVIDDNSDIRYILSEILTDNGHTVSSADDGKIGMALTDTNQYDLIITDIVMPNMDGIEVITEIKMKHLNVKIIAMTGGSAKLDRDFLAGISKAMRVDKVITKPFNVRDVQKVVDELLNV